MFLANFENANLRSANFDDTTLFAADLRGADLSYASLRGAEIARADFSNAVLVGTDFQGALANSTDFSGTLFEPINIPKIESMFATRGLHTAYWENSPSGLVMLREAFKKAGMRRQEKEVTFAIRRSERINDGGVLSAVRYTFFELPVGYGLYPFRSVAIICAFVFMFAIFYYLSISGRRVGGQVFLIWPSDSIKALTSNPANPELLGKKGISGVKFALYFSLLSASHIGWRDLNVGSWIARLSPEEFGLRGTGSVRVLSGLQSLLTVYLLALAVLAYFGRPFD